METMIEDSKATALYIYPAKALANDQLHVLEKLENSLNINIYPNTYDGDTPRSKSVKFVKILELLLQILINFI